ncbi:hypothetical protein [Actinoplanes sp. RD1]|uniref:hypothetical protein n=1 Tax=Actinoplanes sp. RD1 TaxID=3064538 RepID=UPI0027413939|nr:hypothetical protein [Actinoplanes sp. RD1]
MVRPLSLSAQVSYDDGATWREAAPAGTAATVTYPAGSGFVSLRLTATAGTSAFEQTVIRAYRFG